MNNADGLDGVVGRGMAIKATGNQDKLDKIESKIIIVSCIQMTKVNHIALCQREVIWMLQRMEKRELSEVWARASWIADWNYISRVGVQKWNMKRRVTRTVSPDKVYLVVESRADISQHTPALDVAGDFTSVLVQTCLLQPSTPACRELQVKVQGSPKSANRDNDPTICRELHFLPVHCQPLWFSQTCLKFY